MTRARHNDGPVVRTAMPLWLAAITLIWLFGSVVYWSINTRIAGAIVAHGRLETRETAHDVTHPIGGRVAYVAVSEGEYVQAGDDLFGLEDTVVSTELMMVSEQFTSLLARQVRLEAERSGSEELVVSGMTQRYLSELPDLHSKIEAERQLFVDRKVAHSRKVEQQHVKRTQIEKQISALDANIDAAQRILKLLRNDLARHEKLLSQGVSAPAQRDSVARTFRLQVGEVGQLQARRAELTERLSENELTVVSLLETLRENAQVDLDAIFVEISRLNAERNKLLERQQQLTVQAVISGNVHNLQIRGAGSYVRTGMPAATIIPDSQDFRAIVHVKVPDIDQVHINQESGVRFLAFNSRSLPQLTGTVEAIGAEVKIDPLTRTRFYEVWVSIPSTEFEYLTSSQVLVNGMEVISFIRTDYQTPFEYVTRPIRDYFVLAFRDRA